MTVIVARCNYGDDSIALLAYLQQLTLKEPERFSKLYCVYIDTGWSAKNWPARVQQGEAFARHCGFIPVILKPKMSFSELVIERDNFPLPKFQWCAGFLKGLPLIDWLDERDIRNEWIIAIPKRQALYRKPIPASIPECEHHGERQVWHPMIQMSHEERDALVLQAGFSLLKHRSLECEPCINSTQLDLAQMSSADKSKQQCLELAIGKRMVFVHAQSSESSVTPMDQFSMGCGDPFGCGL